KVLPSGIRKGESSSLVVFTRSPNETGIDQTPSWFCMTMYRSLPPLEPSRLLLKIMVLPSLEMVALGSQYLELQKGSFSALLQLRSFKRLMNRSPDPTFNTSRSVV